MGSHLWESHARVSQLLAQETLSPDAARIRCLISAFLLAVIAQIAIAFNELYDFRISSSRFDRASRFVTSSGVALAVGLGAVLLARAWELHRVLDFPGLNLSQLVQTLVFTMLLGFGLIYFWRYFFHFALRRWHFNERVLVLGAGPTAQDLVNEMLERTDSGYEVVGMLPENAGGEGRRRGDARNRLRSSEPAGAVAPKKSEATALAADAHAQAGGEAVQALLLKPLAVEIAHGPEAGSNGNGNGHGNENGNGHTTRTESLYEMVRRLRVDVVVVALEDRRGSLPTDDLLRCRLEGTSVKEQEELYERITGKIAVGALRPSYLILNDGFGRTPQGQMVKRATDICLSLLGLLFLWPVMLATAIAVRLDSRGGVLFKQERVGRDGRPFTVFKFRSMNTGAESATGPVWAAENDPRITRTGRFIRKSRVDELPQLLNILAGDMSLVGPRPERGVFVEKLSSRIPYYSQRHIVKPGLTGWAQINYPYGNSVEDAREKLQYDLFYIKNRSILFDLSILFTTIKTVLLRKGT
jgi:lipopolysaccharide/colanic/teichoic acid biosynthesis glycosyltransferase